MSHVNATTRETHHDQAHPASDMVAQHGPTVQGSNTDSTATNAIPFAPAMAALAGTHGPAAMAAGARDASGTELFDLPVSPKKDEDTADARMTGSSSRRRMDTSRTPTDRGASRSTSVKRGSAESGGRPPRGRPDPPWENDLRAVHRRVQ